MENVDTFSADTTEQAAIDHQLRDLISRYEDDINKIRTTCNQISTSSAWKDTTIKDNFTNTLNNYIASFEDLKTEMITQVDDLTSNTSEVDSIESAFS